MANIVIDPVIVMTPGDDLPRLEAQTWLENLTIWLKEALSAPYTWLHYLKASELLEAHERFPNFARLKHLQQKHRLDINISQIARNIDTFFRDETFDLEGHLQRLEFAIEPEIGSISIQPEEFITRLPEYLHEDLQKLLANCCACKHIDLPFGRALHIATLALANNPAEVAISAVIIDALPDFALSADNRITQFIPLLITPDDLLPLTDPITLWAKGEQGILYAIKQQYKRNWSDDPLMFRLGPRFIESVKERELETNEIVLRSIVRAASDVIANKAKDIPGYRLHPYRVTETADSPQLIRDSDRARAWRLMIQKHGAGWRLHYWQIPTSEGSTIEFANICKESEREIY